MTKKKKISPEKQLKPTFDEIIPKKRKDYYYCIRIPHAFHKEMLLYINRRIGMSKNSWILEAIQEKMYNEDI